MNTHRVAKPDMCEPSDERAAAVAANDNTQRDAAHPISFVPTVLVPAPAPVVRAGLRAEARQREPVALMGNALAGRTGHPQRGRGRRLPATLEALDRRDQLVREMAGRFFVGYSASATASAIHTELIRYRASGWVRERVEPECPVRHRGRLREFAWHILMTKDFIPSVRALRRTLANKPF